MPFAPRPVKRHLGVNTALQGNAEARLLRGCQHQPSVINKSGVEIDLSVSINRKLQLQRVSPFLYLRLLGGIDESLEAVYHSHALAAKLAVIIIREFLRE